MQTIVILGIGWNRNHSLLVYIGLQNGSCLNEGTPHRLRRHRWHLSVVPRCSWLLARVEAMLVWWLIRINIISEEDERKGNPIQYDQYVVCSCLFICFSDVWFLGSCAGRVLNYTQMANLILSLNFGTAMFMKDISCQAYCSGRKWGESKFELLKLLKLRIV